MYNVEMYVISLEYGSPNIAGKVLPYVEIKTRRVRPWDAGYTPPLTNTYS
jgi:hypothetical protein